MDASKQMARMVEAVQPHCDEPIRAALTCSHAGSMGSVLLTRLTDGMVGIPRTSDLPNPVFLAVGSGTVYAFDYRPRGFRFKIKRAVARWPRTGLTVDVETTDRMCYFTLTTVAGEVYAMEVTTVMGAGPVVDLFIGELAATG